MCNRDNEIVELVNSFISELDEGIWNEELYKKVKIYIIKNSIQFRETIPTYISDAYYHFGATIQKLYFCCLDTNDVYEIKNLSIDDFCDKYEINCMLMNVAFGSHSIDRYPILV